MELQRLPILIGKSATTRFSSFAIGAFLLYDSSSLESLVEKNEAVNYAYVAIIAGRIYLFFGTEWGMLTDALVPMNKWPVRVVWSLGEAAGRL